MSNGPLPLLQGPQRPHPDRPLPAGRRKDRFDRIIIETSGLADPNPVAQTFFVDEEISSNIELDAIVTLVGMASTSVITSTRWSAAA